jgi:hypothetical protein
MLGDEAVLSEPNAGVGAVGKELAGRVCVRLLMRGLPRLSRSYKDNAVTLILAAKRRGCRGRTDIARSDGCSSG